MELADGGNLSALRGMGYLQIVPVLLEVAAALGYAHSRGVVHRDLKASNVLFDSSGQTKLADFGVAAVLRGSGAEQDIARAFGGSPFTASPEQLRGEPPSPSDDIYGFGALAYELLAGHQPYFPNFDAGQIQSGVVPQLVPARRAPVQLIELVMQMLAKRVEERPGSMHEVAEALELTLGATLALDLTELADLSAGPGELARSAAPKPSASPKRAHSGGAVAERVALSAPARAEVAPRSATVKPQAPIPSALPEPQAQSLSVWPEPPEIALSSNPYRDAVSSLRKPLPEPWERPGPYGGHRVRRHRGRILAFGLFCALGGAAVMLLGNGSPSAGTFPRLLSTVMAQLQGGRKSGVAHTGAVDPPAFSSAPSPAIPATPVSPPSSPDSPVSGSLSARGARIEARLSVLAARGAATWDGADFAAAKRQILEARSVQQRRGAVAARRHWLAAASLLKRVGSQAPRAERVPAKPAAQALAGGRQPDAVPAGHYSRAAYFPRRALARAPRSARAGTVLTSVRRSFRDVGYHKAVRAGLAAIAAGRLYHAQADFLQALVYRPQGIEAATELGRVNQILYRRAPLSARAAARAMGSD
jgi:hypothetical protein